MGLYTEKTLYYTGISLAGLILGIFFARPFLEKLSANNYRKFIILIIFIAGILCFCKGIYK